SSSVGNTILFAGRELDAETGLYYNRARYYSAGLGNFISQDPAAADINLYRYCGGNPTGATDPTGLRAPAGFGEFVPGAISSVAGLNVQDGEGTGDEGWFARKLVIGSMIRLSAQFILNQMRDAQGPLACDVGWVQIVQGSLNVQRSGNDIFLNPFPIYSFMQGNHRWQLDGGLPYLGHHLDPNEPITPGSGLSNWVTLPDNPGLPTTHGWGWKVTDFSQDFQSYLVALNGREMGAVYAGVFWGHSFTLIPGRSGDSSSDYVANRYIRRVTSVSPDFMRILSDAFDEKYYNDNFTQPLI
ncbi:MAG: RHS repeat-associated core domain-containing protein, partial [Thermoguttaceae bacterium]